MQKDMLKETQVTFSIEDEMGAYESLWDNQVSSFKQLNEIVNKNSLNSLQSFVGTAISKECYELVISKLTDNELSSLKITSIFSEDYPQQILDAKYPFPILYTLGDYELINTPSIAIVGSRNASSEGVRRARKISYLLAKRGYTIISGLAKGIDTAAHKAALEAGARTIAVIGTPTNKAYPKENSAMQKLIAQKHLVVSSVPFLRHWRCPPSFNRMFFPERNKLMSAISKGTIIVEAGETSGTLIQARAALEQGRKLYILQSCFENKSISWPLKYEKMGAIRVRDINDIEHTI